MPTVYLVREPLSNGALPGDHLIDWGQKEWTLQRQVEPPQDFTHLKRLRHNPQSSPHGGEPQMRSQSPRQPAVGRP